MTDEVDPTLVAMIDALPGCLAYIDRDFRYRVTNATFRSWFGDASGRTVAELIGMTAFELVRGNLEAALCGTPIAFEARVIGPEGRPRWVQTRYTPHVANGCVHGVIAAIEDVTSKKLAEDHLSILAHASKAIAGASDLRATTTEIADGLVPALGEWCALFIEIGGGLTEVHAPGLDVEHVRDQARSLVHRATEQAVVHDIEGSSAVVVRLSAHATRVGTLVIGAAQPTRWVTDDLQLVEELARRAASALQAAVLLYEQREVNVRLREADRRKDEFLAVLGHELRNPLAPIITALDLMALRGGGFEREREVIRRHAEYMTRLVDDLLDVSRITGGKIDLNREPLQLASVIARAIEVTSPILESRTHQLAVDVPAELHVFGDDVRLTQVFSNLLINAAKYTPPQGKIAIAARAEHAGSRDGLVIAVTDNGSGIAPEIMPKIFEPFVQGTRTVERAKGGLGLGLALVRSLVELHEGQVTAYSAGPGQGSTFTVTLPRHVPQPADDTCASGAAGKLLLVEDNVDTAMLYGELLRRAGYDVAIAYDGPRALELAQHVQPDVAVLDIGLPVMDGYELARHLRDQFSALHLVAMSGYGQHEDPARSQAAGFAVHLAKPVEVDDLIRALRRS